MAKKVKERTLSKADLTFTFTCVKCEKVNTTSLENMSGYGDSSDCELCGSHGSVEINFHCAECGKYYTIEINSW